MREVTIDISSRNPAKRDVFDALDEDVQVRLTDASQKYLNRYFWEMSIRDFLDAQSGKRAWFDVSRIPTLAEYILLSRFSSFCDTFTQAVENYTISDRELRKEEIKASRWCKKMSIAESMQVFMQRYFGMRSFDDALDFTLGDYILAKKADYNAKIFERKYNEYSREELAKKQKR